MVPEKTTRILIVAGEASGDSHAARLVAALRNAAPERKFEFFGSTGPQMRSEGVETVVSADQFSVVGVPEVVRALPMFFGALKALQRAAVDRRPDVAILVDFPEFNLKLAKALKASGIKVVYYISPQLWAWRKYRIRTIRRHVDLLISIFPFEKGWYEENGVGHVVFAGNPTVAEMHPAVPRTEFRTSHGFDDSRPLVALLPGSRHKEVVRILPRLLLTAKAMRERDVSLQFVVAMSRLRTSAEVSESFRRAGLREDFFGEDLKIVFGETVDALGASDVSAVTSGTATLETAVIGTPMAIVYCSSKINYALLKPLIDVEHIGLVNLIAGRRLATELLQDDFTPDALSAELFRLLDHDVNHEMREELRVVTDSLKGQDASLNAARAVLGVLD